MSEVFHVAPLMLGPGSVVLPGNWGRLLDEIGADHTSWERERVLESVRVQYFPDKPSRLNATFALLSLEEAQLYRRLCQPRCIIYRASFADLGARIHIGDYNAVDPIHGTGRSREEAAKRYWQGLDSTNIVGHEDIKCRECVSASALVIVNRVH